MRSSVQIACEVLDELENHSGFEGWWNGLTDDTRDEILTRLSSVVHEDWAQGPQAPIALLTINTVGDIAGVSIYSPGLPPGDHELYVEAGAVGFQPVSAAGEGCIPERTTADRRPAAASSDQP
jgi:hypothetical protein